MARWYIIHAYSGFENKVRDSVLSEAERMGLTDFVEAVEVPVETHVLDASMRVFAPAFACSTASCAATIASRSVRESRFASRRGRVNRASASAAMSVGNVSPGKRVSFPMPARDSTIDCHTSALLRPIEQMMPAPVTAIRVFGSGLRIVG